MEDGFANGHKQIRTVLYWLSQKHIQITINFQFSLCLLDTQVLQVYSEKIKAGNFRSSTYLLLKLGFP